VDRQHDEESEKEEFDSVPQIFIDRNNEGEEWDEIEVTEVCVSES